MASEQALVVIDMIAGADLSAGQYYFVTLATDGQVDLTGSAGGTSIGILQNKPSAAGEVAQVGVFGVSKCKAGATITADDKLQSTAAGKADVAASGDHVVAHAMEGAVDGDVFRVLVGYSEHILA